MPPDYPDWSIVVIIPLVIAVGATLGSAAAQRIRPVRMSNLASD